MRTIRNTLVALAASLFFVGIAFAQTASDFRYITEITVTNNTGAALTNVAVRAPIGALNMVNGGFLGADGQDILVLGKSDGTETLITAQDLGVNSASWWVPIASLADGASATFSLYTGDLTGSADNPQAIWLQGASENVTVTDDATLDPTGDFSLETTDITFGTIGSAEQPLIRHEGAFEVGVRSLNTVYARVVDAATTATSAGNPTATGEGSTAVNLIESGCSAGSQEDCVDTNDGDTSYVYSNTASGFLDSYYTLSSGLPTGAVISSVTGTARGRCVSAAASFDVKVGVRIGGSEAEQTINFSTTSYVTTTTANISAPGGGSWEDITPASLDGGEIKLSVDNTASCPTGAESRVTWVYLTITYFNAVETTYSPIAADTEYDITAEVTGGQLTLVIDDVQQTPTNTGFVVRATTKDLLMGGGFTGTTQRQDIRTSAVGGMLGMLPTLQIVETCLSVAAATFTFTLSEHTIPSWANHLVFSYVATGDRAAGNLAARIYFNGDTSSIYNYQVIQGAGASASAARTDAAANASVGFISGTTHTAGTVGTGTVLIPEYANTSRHKATVSYSGAGENIAGVFTTRTALTDAITSITIRENGAGNLDSDSCFTLSVVDERYSVFSSTLSGAGNLDATGIAAFTGQLAGIAMLRGDNAATTTTFSVEFNGDTTAGNYAGQLLRGSASSASGANVNNFGSDITADTATANAFAPWAFSIAQFSAGNDDPTLTSIGGYHQSSTASARVDATFIRRNNVAAVNQVTLAPSSNFVSGSSLWLYMVPQVLIERVTVGGGGAATIAFSSIPQDRGALTLNLYGRTDAAANSDNITVEFNGDTTAANYDRQRIQSAGGSVGSASSAASNEFFTTTGATEGANEFGGGTMYLPGYADTDVERSGLTFTGLTNSTIALLSYRWESSAAITSILLTPANGTAFDQNTTAELWGLAPDTTPAYAVDFTYEPDAIAQTQEGNGGNSWTWLGTVQDQTANDNDGVYTFVRDTTNQSVSVGPLVSISIAVAPIGNESGSNVVTGTMDTGFATPFDETGAFGWPISIFADVATDNQFPAILLAGILVIFAAMVTGLGSYAVVRTKGLSIILAALAASVMTYITPMPNVMVFYYALMAVAMVVLVRQPFESEV